MEDLTKPSSRKDPCGICGRKTILNAVLCESWGIWIHGRCQKIERVTNTLAIDLKCWKCNWCHENVDQKKLLYDVETMTNFSYVDDIINSGGGCEAAVRHKARIGWAKYRDCHDLLC